MASLTEIPLTQPQHDISIAEIAIFSVPLVLRIYQNFHRRRTQGAGWKVDFVVLFCIDRILGGALYLAAKSPTDSILIGALILQSLGSTFLLAELSSQLIAYLDRPKHNTSTSNTKPIRLSIQLLRPLILIAIALYITAYNISSTSTYLVLEKAGAIIILAVYILTLAFFLYFSLHARPLLSADLSKTLSFLVASLALPFLLVRVIYLVLASFRVDDGRFVSIFGDWRYEVGMSVAMEVGAVAFLVAAGFLADDEVKRIGEESVEFRGDGVKFGGRGGSEEGC